MDFIVYINYFHSLAWYFELWNKFSAANGFELCCWGGTTEVLADVIGLAREIAGGWGAANIGADVGVVKFECKGCVGRGGAGLSCVDCWLICAGIAEAEWAGIGAGCATVGALLLHCLLLGLLLLARLEDTVVAIDWGGQLSVVVTLLRLKLLTLLKHQIDILLNKTESPVFLSVKSFVQPWLFFHTCWIRNNNVSLTLNVVYGQWFRQNW